MEGVLLNCLKMFLTLNEALLPISVCFCRISDFGICLLFFQGLGDPFRMPEESSPRQTPQSVPYQDLPHLVNADGQYLFCRYWKPTGTPK